MAIKYKKVKQRIINKSGEEKEVYYARACKRRRVDLNEVADHLSQLTTLSRPDVYCVLIALADTIPHYLLNNKSVELGDLGTISLHFTSNSNESEKEVTWRSIKDLKVQFRAGKRIKEKLKHASFKMVK